MGDKSKIEWTATYNPDGTVTPGATWNPVTGCSHVSPGCEHCYAEALSLRMGWSKQPWGAQHAAENVVLHPERLDQPLRWQKPRRIFVNSMSDLFHEQIPDEYVAAVFGVMAAAPQHTFQVLTKRPERMLRFFTKVEEWTAQSFEVYGDDMAEWRRWCCLVAAAIRQTGSGHLADACSGPTPWPLPNVWLGVSAETQRFWDERVSILSHIPAAVRFVSYEPALGPINTSETFGLYEYEDGKWALKVGSRWAGSPDWVICGGESGLQHRPFDLDWARQIRDHCVAAGVPFFFKQVGGRTPKAGGRVLDGRTWDEFPMIGGHTHAD